LESKQPEDSFPVRTAEELHAAIWKVIKKDLVKETADCKPANTNCITEFPIRQKIEP
jgi:hypothetical protein